ncbi:MAG: peroxiredoxin-like family protein [Pseudolabrys sp.]
MNDITPLIPRQPVPALKVALAGGGSFDLAREQPKNFTMIVYYRGLHCPQCRKQLTDLEAKLGDFEKRGVSVVAISGDDAERGERTKKEWSLPNLRVGYGLDMHTARAFGLWVSAGRGKTSAGIEEPALFNEPGLFLIRPDRTLYCASVQTMPFARPQFADLLTALDFIIEKNYPARGDVPNLQAQAAE